MVDAPEPGTDPLSPLAQRIIQGAAYDRLVVPGAAPAGARELLDGVTPDQLLAAPIASPAHAAAMLAGLWLRHDALAESHEIAQKSPEEAARYGRGKSSKTSLDVRPASPARTDVDRQQRSLADAGASLSFWHAVLHRREGDFSNAKYWYARCRTHPALAPLGASAALVIHPLPADKSLLRLIANGWNPAAFVDLAEQIHRRPDDPRAPAAVALQQLEWRLLFDHCARAAAGN